jgi:hypothetical protein
MTEDKPESKSEPDVELAFQCYPLR